MKASAIPMTDLGPQYCLYGPVLRFEVLGVPVGQGRVSFLGKGRGAKHSNAATLKPWREKVAGAAHNAVLADRRAGLRHDFPLSGPVGLHMHFTMPKPKSAPKTRRTFPDTRPDISHLIRAVEDAISLPAENVATRLLNDDGQIVYELATKAYPGEELHALPEPGVLIYLYTIGVSND